MYYLVKVLFVQPAFYKLPVYLAKLYLSLISFCFQRETGIYVDSFRLEHRSVKCKSVSPTSQDSYLKKDTWHYNYVIRISVYWTNKTYRDYNLPEQQEEVI